jgi:hypothetical protein
MNQKLELIRQKCIEANPEIRDDAGCFIHCRMLQGGQEWGDSCMCKVRTVRLADVVNFLRTIKGSGNANRYAAWALELIGIWNLRKDDLNEQSEETINFLSELLK